MQIEKRKIEQRSKAEFNALVEEKRQSELARKANEISNNSHQNAPAQNQIRNQAQINEAVRKARENYFKN